MITVMILTGLIIGSAVLAAFVVLVAGIRGTDRRFGLGDPTSDGLAAAFARRVLGVYVRQTTDHDLAEDQDDCYGQVGR
jgi:hypothetical protein